MPKGLAGRTAVVTGAARGIGAAIAARLAGEGASVLIVDVDGDEAEELASNLRTQSVQATALRIDITDDVQVASLADHVRTLGGCSILVNNAAILDATPLNELDIERLDTVMNVNLAGPLRTTRALLSCMPAGSGRILNVSSIMGLRGAPDSLAYSASKAGLISMTRCLACDLAPRGIIVNAIAPGFVDTRMAVMPDGQHEHDTEWFKKIYIEFGRIPMRRAGLPVDVANAALFFCSDDCTYVTGQTLCVDGGLTATF